MKPTSPNMNYFYNIEYFDPLKDESVVRSLEDVTKKEDEDKKIKKKSPELSFKAQNHYLKNFDFNFAKEYVASLERAFNGVEGFTSFDLWTIYPGLLIGTGNAHDISAKDAITGGFEFDWTSGLPVIPGSSLKGVLRSMFKEEKRKRPQEADLALEELIKTLIGKTDVNVDDLREEIFDYNDIFLGGYPIISDEDGAILREDYITPHAAKGPTANPVPISILKVKPKVQYRFLFILHDGKMVSAEEKKALFMELLQLSGAGAKTNVGFGQFVTEEVNQSIKEPDLKEMKNVIAQYGLLQNEKENDAPPKREHKTRDIEKKNDASPRRGYEKREVGKKNDAPPKREYTPREIDKNNDNRPQQERKNRDTNKKTGRVEWKKGYSYRGTVTNYNEQKTKAFGCLDDGSRFSLYFKNVGAKPGEIDKTVPKGTIQVTYMGVDEKGYDTWSLYKE